MEGNSDKMFSTMTRTRKRKFVNNKAINVEENQLVPVLEKLSVDEFTDNKACSKFIRSIQLILENVDQSLIAKYLKDNELIVQDDLLISDCNFQDLCTGAAKLKFLGVMKKVPVDQLVQLINVLEINIRSAENISFITALEENQCEINLLNKVMSAADASLCCLYIMTSSNMPKRIYLEDCIDRIILFIKYQLYNAIFPHYNAVHRTCSKSSRKKSSNFQPSSKEMSVFYYKIYELTKLLPELINIQSMTDTAILNLSSVCLPTLFSENIPELQLSCLKLITTIFTVYEKHRKSLLEDILESVTKIPSKQKSYRLSNAEQIHILTAIILELVQCTTILPENLINQKLKKGLKQIDNDMLICNKYEQIIKTGATFLTIFLNKCSNKNEEMVYKPLLDIFVKDLLLMVNKPEWPGAELLLNLLGNLLVKNLSNKDMDISWRGLSLDYLGLITAKLKEHTISSDSNIDIINQIIKEFKLEENSNIEEENMKILHCVLLDFLAVNIPKKEVFKYARYFYIVQWYKDATQKKTSITSSDTNKTSGATQREDKKNRTKGKRNNEDLCEIIDERKKMYINKIQPLILSDKQINIDYSDAEIISQFLMSKRSFSQSFDAYFRTILLVLRENSNTIRTKAIKCLATIVETDSSVLGNKVMQIAVHHSFLDHSAAVREAVVDLVGKFILSQPDLIDKYYEMLSARILDTSISVRKRVIKIFRDICLEYPEFPKISEICIKMIRRVTDEEGINKLVIEIFQNMWFTPVSESSTDILIKKVINITSVVESLKDIGLEWFEQLLVQMFAPKENKVDSTKVEPPKNILVACQQIVDCLMENIIHLKESNVIIQKGGCSKQIETYMTSLSLFAKVRPQLLIKHATTFQPLLSLNCETRSIISSIACILELVIPLIENPDMSFLGQLEQDFVKLISHHDRTVISSLISCLNSIVNVTKNFTLIRECFKQWYDHVQKFKYLLEFDTEKIKNIVSNCKPIFKRAVYIIGLFLKHFDFTDTNVIGDLPENIKDQVFEIFLYFLHHEDEDIQSNTLKAIGFICIRYYDFMMNSDLKKFYHNILIKEVSLQMKSDVLQNIEMYLTEEENRIIKKHNCENQENLKEIIDVSMGSSIIQFYIKPILTSYIHPHITVRQAFLKVIKIILRQGLVYPEHIVPYLICMSTDSEKILANNANTHLMEIDLKYPGFIHTKSHLGVQLSYQLQTLLQVDIVRGFKITEQEYPSALNDYLYSLLRNSKQQRRILLKNMLRQFDEQHTNVPYMLYLADNLAYFPYSVLDEPLFIIHHINLKISLTGSNLLQSFRDGLTDSENIDALDEDDEDAETLISKLPKNTTNFQSWITSAQGCLLLLILKEYLKDIYGLTDGKISQYSPSEATKIYEKPVTRRNNTTFNPKSIVNRLKEGSSKKILDKNGRKKLIAEYLNFKQLMLKLDLKDPSNDKK